MSDHRIMITRVSMSETEDGRLELGIQGGEIVHHETGSTSRIIRFSNDPRRKRGSRHSHGRNAGEPSQALELESESGPRFEDCLRQSCNVLTSDPWVPFMRTSSGAEGVNAVSHPVAECQCPPLAIVIPSPNGPPTLLCRAWAKNLLL